MEYLLREKSQISQPGAEGEQYHRKYKGNKRQNEGEVSILNNSYWNLYHNSGDHGCNSDFEELINVFSGVLSSCLC